ncbi:MAG: TMF family protein [Gammaproteobacteria bacterium]
MSPMKLVATVKNFFLRIGATRNMDSERMRRAQQARQADAAQDEGVEEYIVNFDAQIKEKDAQIEMLREENQKLLKENLSAGEKQPDGDFPGMGILSQALIEKAGRELYHGEFADRVRLAMGFCAHSENGTDARTKAVLKNLLGLTKYSGGSDKLKKRMKDACKDHKKMPAAVGRLLVPFSFERREGKHTVYLPPEDLPGIERVTLPQSPSSPRSVKQQESDLIRKFGLQDI